MDNIKLQRFVQVERERVKRQEAVAELTEKCWDQCMGKPSNRLDSRTESCLQNCVQRYIDSSNYIVNRLHLTASQNQPSGPQSFM